MFFVLLLSLDPDKSCFKSLLSFYSTRIFAYILLDENLFLSYGIVILSALFSFDECDSSQIFAVSLCGFIKFQLLQSKVANI